METDPEPPGIGGRVRWGNVARVVALAAVAAVVVAWPRLRAPAPEVPQGAAVPVREAPATVAEPAPATAAAPVPQPPATADAADVARRASPTRQRTRGTRTRRTPEPRPPRRAKSLTTTRAAPPPPASPAVTAPSARWRPPPGEFDVEP